MINLKKEIATTTASQKVMKTIAPIMIMVWSKHMQALREEYY